MTQERGTTGDLGCVQPRPGAHCLSGGFCVPIGGTTAFVSPTQNTGRSSHRGQGPRAYVPAALLRSCWEQSPGEMRATLWVRAPAATSRSKSQAGLCGPPAWGWGAGSVTESLGLSQQSDPLGHHQGPGIVHTTAWHRAGSKGLPQTSSRPSMQKRPKGVANLERPRATLSQEPTTQSPRVTVRRDAQAPWASWVAQTTPPPPPIITPIAHSTHPACVADRELTSSFTPSCEGAAPWTGRINTMFPWSPVAGSALGTFWALICTGQFDPPNGPMR